MSLAPVRDAAIEAHEAAVGPHEEREDGEHQTAAEDDGERDRESDPGHALGADAPRRPVQFRPVGHGGPDLPGHRPSGVSAGHHEAESRDERADDDCDQEEGKQGHGPECVSARTGTAERSVGTHSRRKEAHAHGCQWPSMRGETKYATTGFPHWRRGLEAWRNASPGVWDVNTP